MAKLDEIANRSLVNNRRSSSCSFKSGKLSISDENLKSQDILYITDALKETIEEAGHSQGQFSSHFAQLAFRQAQIELREVIAQKANQFKGDSHYQTCSLKLQQIWNLTAQPPDIGFDATKLLNGFRENLCQHSSVINRMWPPELDEKTRIIALANFWHGACELEQTYNTQTPEVESNYLLLWKMGSDIEQSWRTSRVFDTLIGSPLEQRLFEAKRYQFFERIRAIANTTKTAIEGLEYPYESLDYSHAHRQQISDFEFYLRNNQGDKNPQVTSEFSTLALEMVPILQREIMYSIQVVARYYSPPAEFEDAKQAALNAIRCAQKVSSGFSVDIQQVLNLEQEYQRALRIRAGEEEDFHRAFEAGYNAETLANAIGELQNLCIRSESGEELQARDFEKYNDEWWDNFIDAGWALLHGETCLSLKDKFRLLAVKDDSSKHHLELDKVWGAGDKKIT